MEFRIGINVGDIIIDRGDIWGDGVNVAARLEALTKTLGCEVLMSEEVYERAGFGPDDLPAHEVDARGREAIVKARSVARAADLARLIATQAPAAAA